MKLTPKQELFVKEYLVDLNATQASIRAGYSENTARQIGTENLSKPVIQEAIQKAMSKRSAKAELTADYILTKLRDIVENDEEQTKDRLKGLELLGKHMKLFTDKVETELTGEVKVTINVPPVDHM